MTRPRKILRAAMYGWWKIDRGAHDCIISASSLMQSLRWLCPELLGRRDHCYRVALATFAWYRRVVTDGSVGFEMLDR